jgi:hypothetical protein
MTPEQQAWWGPRGAVPRKVRSALARARGEARAQTHVLRPWKQLPSVEPGQTKYAAPCWKCPAFVVIVVTEAPPGVRKQILIRHYGTDQPYSHPWLSGW